MLCLVILLLIVLLKRLRQPYFIAYLLAGIALGPGVFGVFSQDSVISGLGDIGLLLLMFFLGMEIEIPDRKALLFQPLIAQFVKTLFSFVVAFVAGWWLNWAVANIFILTLLLVFNSTAVVSEILRKNGELHTVTGRIVLNMLLLQDILAAPAYTLISFLTGRPINRAGVLLAIVICSLLFLLLRAIRNRNLFQWTGWRRLTDDHDLQVFAGVALCLGFGTLANLAGLSAAIGSFGAGIFLGKTRAFSWLETALRPFKIFFVALFFVSIGLSLNLPYIWVHRWQIAGIALGVMLVNSVLSSLVFRLLGHRWTTSFQMGALLSQTGELGLLACTLAWQAGIIGRDFYDLCSSVTGLILLVSTIWIGILRDAVKGVSGRSPENGKLMRADGNFVK
jgi:CPA2 family monovalent cation:H+ antiporter-2